MTPIYDPVTGRLLTDPQTALPRNSVVVNHADLSAELDRFILSVSGWRKVFGLDEESHAEELSATDELLLVLAGFTIAEFLRERSTRFPPTIVLGTDSRPTGPAIADILARAMLVNDICVRSLSVCAAPEIMAYTKRRAEIEGFVYVTASHNPVGHNGIKLGLQDGAVLDGERARLLIETFRNNVADHAYVVRAREAVQALEPDRIAELHLGHARWKQEAMEEYASFVAQVIAGQAPEPRATLERLAVAVADAGGGIAVDFNGSARSISIDRLFLRRLGFEVRSLNDRTGVIAHTIIPEGDSLLPCMELLEEAHAENAGFRIGYVPDNDGDRGNLVVYLDGRQRVLPLPAQQGFALIVLAELAWQSFQLERQGKTVPLAVVTNDATSLRVTEIAAAFGARVFRAEVGEANVVNLAQAVRAEGYLAPVLGEGSNGGAIIHPSTVRDPLTAVGSVVKLLHVRDAAAAAGKTDLFALWCARSNRNEHYCVDFSLDDVLDSLPVYQTTATTDPEAVMQIHTSDHAVLKRRYEQEFLRQWEMRRGELESRFGIVSYEELNCEGIEERNGFGPEFRTGTHRGGMKLQFLDQAQRPIAFIWMRGSGTEPVFRVLADVRSADRDDARYLLDWHRSMIEAADRRI